MELNTLSHLEKLKEERARLYKVFDALPAFVYLQDQQDKIRFANKTFIKKFGHPGNKPCYLVIEGRDRPCEECYTKEVFETNEVMFWEKTLDTGDIYDIQVLPFIDIDDTPLALVFGFNITERIRTEQELCRLDRLNLIGEMAAGIAHEVRNPLTTVRGLLQLLDQKKELEMHHDYFELMIEELDRANGIITEFLSLAKTKEINIQLTNLRNITNSLGPLLEAEANKQSKSISFELQEVPLLLLDEKQIRQLILNLVKNAFDAIKCYGIVTIKIFVEGPYVVLSVQDEGTGINQKIIDKIGTPFVTTKEKGTGLGLSICYSIAARHNAEIKFSTSCDGTTFMVYFKIPPIENSI